MNELLLEPLKGYESQLAARHRENTAAFFEELLARSGVNEAQNRATVKEYDAEQAAIAALNKRISRYQLFRVLLIIACVIGAVLLLAGIALPHALLIPIGAVLVLVSLLLIFLKINPLIKSVKALLPARLARAAALLEEAHAQMAPLNELFDNTDALRLIERTIPEISFDLHFTERSERALIEHCNFVNRLDECESVLNTLAGRIYDNPFLFYRYRRQTMGTKTYYGSLTIHWTETYRDSDGKLRTRHRSQVLTASVTKPMPYYSTHTALIYGAEAAPDLTFSRRAAHTERLSEKERDRKVRAGERELQKRAEQSTMEGGDFREMNNTEFDVLFDALDRTDELEFRLMYTPLAQRNTVDLLCSTAGYGDDFDFYKRGRLNYIVSEHAQGWNMNTSTSNYVSHSVDIARANFQSFNEAFFKSVYFDFAPLMAVPAYQEEPCYSLREPYADASNYTGYEHESLVNALGQGRFAPRDAATESILKTDFSAKNAKTDLITVTAHAFAAFDRLDLVPMWGDDGKLHNVPVPWVEYVPTERRSDVAVVATGQSEREFRNAPQTLPSGVHFHGLYAYPNDACD